MASRRVIVTADDFGLAIPVNEAVERAHREGVLTTASLVEPLAGPDLQAFPQIRRHRGDDAKLMCGPERARLELDPASLNERFRERFDLSVIRQAGDLGDGASRDSANDVVVVRETDQNGEKATRRLLGVDGLEGGAHRYRAFRSGRLAVPASVR